MEEAPLCSYLPLYVGINVQGYERIVLCCPLVIFRLVSLCR